jgi:erythromycin esterase
LPEPTGLDDLGVFAEIVGDARVWCFGEATHGAHEYLALRNRLFAFAVKHLGFTAIAAETNMSDARAVDAYVSGREPMSRRVAQSVFSANEHFRWTEEPFEENLELIRWIRGHNDEAQEKVRFFGIDAGWSAAAPPEWDASVLVSSALEYLFTADEVIAGRLDAAFAPFQSRFNSDDQWSLTQGERLALSEALAELLRSLGGVGGDGVDAWREAFRDARVASVLDPVTVEGRGPKPVDEDEFRGERDASMAENVMTLLHTGNDRERIFVFASDGHVSRRRWPLSDPAWPYPAMGELLASQLAGDMVVTVSAHRGGSALGVGAVEREVAPELPLGSIDAADLPAVVDLRAGGETPWDWARGYCEALIVLDQVSPVRPVSEVL